MKLKTIIQLSEWISHAPAMNRNPDSQLRPVPGGWNDDSPNWDGVVEGKDWFCYMEGNDWHNHVAGASVYINEEGDRPHKVWVKIKTHGLRKKGDTNELFKERVQKHIKKVAGSWTSAAKKLHNNPELNEVGNPVPISWRQAFREATQDPKVKAHLADCGEAAIADPVNFTPRIGEEMTQRKISYSAVVLEDSDQHKLLDTFKDNIPNDWKKYAHHMTIKMGELPSEKKQDIGQKVELVVKAIGQTDKAIAVKVDGYWTTNQIEHITLAVNTANGGKPVDSNKIENWLPISEPIKVRGTVMEIPFR